MAGPSRVRPVAVKQGFVGEPANLMGLGNQAWLGDAGVVMETGPLVSRPVHGTRALPPHEE
jgi:hypothetical protein